MLALLALGACLPCHAAVVESYARTGMGRSFQSLNRANAVEDFTRANTVAHAASQSRFTMLERDGRFYMRREHATAGSAEKEMHYVLGSGNHARSYVHRTSEGRLLALPVSWYRGPLGGYWQMAPGFDRADHPHFRRRIGYDCFFCHNGYPKLPANADSADPVYLTPLPEGIDCSRCHGSPAEHLRKPVRGNILNPRKLPAARQLEVCMQCHLETTSQPLPFAVRRFGREFFSYDPSEPLGSYMVHFDHEDRPPWNEKFEVVSAPYRMMQSPCYQKSGGRMTCTTCHNPHERPSQNDAACRSCHGPEQASRAHANRAEAKQNCIPCHMSRRAPEDAPLTTFTDHRISRRPDTRPGPVLGAYTGSVRIFWPPKENLRTYRAIANAWDSGKPLPEHPEAILFVADKTGKPQFYQAVIQADPRLLGGWRGLARSRFPDLSAIQLGLSRFPADPFLLTLQGEALRLAGRLSDAERACRAAIAADPDQPEPYVNLGVLMAQQGRLAEAIALFRAGLAIDPNNKAAEGNLRLALRPRPPQE
ncbi:MAG: tetratricopeptide repeat protein [Bryobacterales bacterium]|nr:tetratricopeptide repeat protein [Bryobacterales bacterium]